MLAARAVFWRERGQAPAREDEFGGQQRKQDEMEADPIDEVSASQSGSHCAYGTSGNVLDGEEVGLG